MLNWNHLKAAAKYADKEDKNVLIRYIWHFNLAFREAIFLLLLAIFSLIHAIFPFLFDFKLIEWRLQAIKNLKKRLPNDPYLKKIDFK